MVSLADWLSKFWNVAVVQVLAAPKLVEAGWLCLATETSR